MKSLENCRSPVLAAPTEPISVGSSTPVYGAWLTPKALMRGVARVRARPTIRAKRTFTPRCRCTATRRSGFAKVVRTSFTSRTRSASLKSVERARIRGSLRKKLTKGSRRPRPQLRALRRPRNVGRRFQVAELHWRRLLPLGQVRGTGLHRLVRTRGHARPPVTRRAAAVTRSMTIATRSVRPTKSEVRGPFIGCSRRRATV